MPELVELKSNHLHFRGRALPITTPKRAALFFNLLFRAHRSQTVLHSAELVRQIRLQQADFVLHRTQIKRFFDCWAKCRDELGIPTDIAHLPHQKHTGPWWLSAHRPCLFAPDDGNATPAVAERFFSDGAGLSLSAYLSRLCGFLNIWVRADMHFKMGMVQEAEQGLADLCNNAQWRLSRTLSVVTALRHMWILRNSNRSEQAKQVLVRVLNESRISPESRIGRLLQLHSVWLDYETAELARIPLLRSNMPPPVCGGDGDMTMLMEWHNLYALLLKWEVYACSVPQRAELHGRILRHHYESFFYALCINDLYRLHNFMFNLADYLNKAKNVGIDVPAQAILSCYLLIFALEECGGHKEHASWGRITFAEFCLSHADAVGNLPAQWSDDMNPMNRAFYRHLSEKVEQYGTAREQAMFYLVYMRFLRRRGEAEGALYAGVHRQLYALLAEQNHVRDYLLREGYALP
ncbi:hypothetical protein [Conchiformibius kuhniae]|uniref:Uncharacterized protein n=1 Tax=Conchiformibius kuhniae TaxID=211502 RepID=A0ABD8B7V4_9NEIS|nr:hypothetical protein [Conchiformibius kuhniae]